MTKSAFTILQIYKIAWMRPYDIIRLLCMNYPDFLASNTEEWHLEWIFEKSHLWLWTSTSASSPWYALALARILLLIHICSIQLHFNCKKKTTFKANRFQRLQCKLDICLCVLSVEFFKIFLMPHTNFTKWKCTQDYCKSPKSIHV